MTLNLPIDADMEAIQSGIRERAERRRSQGFDIPGLPPMLAMANQQELLHYERMKKLIATHIQLAKDNSQLNNYFPSLERFGTVKRLLIRKIAKVVATLSRFIIRQQTVFNTNAIYSVNLVDKLVRDQAETIEKLNRRIEILEAKLQNK